jgi:hypothetical protein
MTTQSPANRASLPAKTGVYCLANDRVIEWFQMFARSLRHFHPALPLTVIPYNAELAQLKRLATQFHFDLLPEADAARFDALETKVMNMGRHAAMFRKWAAFFGPYDEFMFFDADIAITMPLDDLFAAFARSSFDLLYFDSDISMVYRTEHIAEMQAKYNSAGFNAGAFVSRRGVVSWEQLWRAADTAAADRHLFDPMQVDQPFLNYVFDTMPRRVAHVTTLRQELALKAWARVPFKRDIRRDRVLDAAGQLMPFIHWAGCQYPSMVRKDIFLHYRTLAMNPIERLLCHQRFHRHRVRRRVEYLVKQLYRQ